MHIACYSWPVISIDFYPTIAELTAIEISKDQIVDGKSLGPLLRGADELNRDALFWHYPHYSNQGGFPGGAIRSGDWKLVERYEDGSSQLYNLLDDVGESNDVASGHSERVKAMTEKLHHWYAEVDAKFLRAKPSGPQPWRP